MPEKTVTVVCETCEKEFERRAAEVKRNAKLGRRIFCNESCRSKWLGTLNPLPNALRDNRKIGSMPDQYSPFRTMFRIARRRSKDFGRTFTITLEDLRQLWESQRGVCPLTGWQMNLPASTTEYLSPRPIKPDTATLDRIDNARGYEPDNIQIVAYQANAAKNAFSDADLIAFCHAVARQHPENASGSG